MQVSRWGNSLAVRIPAAVVAAMRLREGDEIEIRAADGPAFEVAKLPTAEEVLTRIRGYRGRLPADFRFVREDVHERE